MTSIDAFLAELDELEKQKDTPPPPNPDLRIPFSFIEVGKSEVFEIRPQKTPPAQNSLIDVTTNPLPLGAHDAISMEWLRSEYLDLQPSPTARENLHKVQRYWPREAYQSPDSLFVLDVSNSRTKLEITTDGVSGSITGYKEVSAADTLSPFTSMSLQRQWTGNPDDHYRGSSNNIPFLPGGLDPTLHPLPTANAQKTTKQIDWKQMFASTGLYTVPPGFRTGMVFEKENAGGGQHTFNLTDILQSEDVDGEYLDEDYAEESEEEEKEDETTTKDDESATKEAEKANEDTESASAPSAQVLVLDEILKETQFAHGRTTGVPKRKDTWASMESVDVSNFYEQFPEMALEFPFDLDVFQKEAIYHLENGESVFVAAHTSAGKTVVAEYAIALAAKHMTRTIYTSPIKALSNQKYRDFKETFGEVGLITGDVSVNPDASCLIVTTEILRSMLYRGADLIRDVEWVIFDEVHYVNDSERGVVWEEVIIMLPAHVNLILLSATVPNTFEFADWIGRTKRKVIHVISTQKRPVPLEHSLHTGNDLFKIVDSKRTFLNLGYKAAAESKKKPVDKKAMAGKSAQTKHNQDRNSWIKLITFLQKGNLTPVVIFAFSKRKCEEFALGLTTIDLTTAAEKSEIHVFVESSLNRLKGSDRRLPQVLQMKDLLQRGIGVHHGGLLPILKEIVEILFSRQLAKVLFATETFAMGVNMPARTVVFSSIRKHDGNNWRDLLPGEYTQMSGRAGRRGLDSVGTVIITAWGDTIPESGELVEMILGKATKLQSQFRLSYNMILNLLRVEEFKVEDMLKRSFLEIGSQISAPQAQKSLQEFEGHLAAVNKELAGIQCACDQQELDEYFDCYLAHNLLKAETQNFIIEAKGKDFLSPGRVVVITNKTYPQGILAIVTKVTGAERHRQLRAFVSFSPNFIDVPAVDATITKEKIKVDLAKLADPKKDPTYAAILAQELQRKEEEFPLSEGGPPKLDPTKDMKIHQLDFVDMWRRRGVLNERLRSSRCHTCPKLHDQLELLENREALKEQVDFLKHETSDDSLALMPEFESRIQVLKEMNYIDADRTVQLKGRVARELNTCDELLATELIFENALDDLCPEEIVALLSAFVFQEKETIEPNLTPTLASAKATLKNIATRVAKHQIACGVPLEVDEYVRSLHFGMMEVTYEWARQLPFKDICDLTEVQEGSIVRCITRLDEACKEIRNVARIVGDTSLYTKMEEASRMIKRDIVFASSEKSKKLFLVDI
eukprot:Phypoly_transcript_00458.p1 GENE.Phypoly_transcript_00458~~Phypoly_transcript_00458.p1  ORF type:complete len:1246 (+),score=257.19 Phypoly_transcript_00458:76-3813(+)